MSNEIKRRVELFLCAALGAEVPGVRFVPSRGGDDATDATATIPPYCGIRVDEAEQAVPGEATWQVSVRVVYMSHLDEATSPEHSAVVQRVTEALDVIPRGYDPGQQILVHGVDLTGTDEAQDDDGQAHADVLSLTMGVSVV